MKHHSSEICIIWICCLIPTNIFGKNYKQVYIVTQIDVINEPGYLMSSSLRLYGRDQAVNGTMTFTQDLYDDVILKLDLYSDTQRNGEFKPMAIELPVMGVCSSLKTYFRRFIKKSIITNINTNFDFENGNVCPIRKGTYWLKDILLDPAGWVSILPTGFIKVKFILMQRNAFGGSFSVVVNIQSSAMFSI